MVVVAAAIRSVGVMVATISKGGVALLGTKVVLWKDGEGWWWWWRDDSGGERCK